MLAYGAYGAYGGPVILSSYTAYSSSYTYTVQIYRTVVSMIIIYLRNTDV